MKRSFTFAVAATLLGGVAYAQAPTTDNTTPLATTLADEQKNYDEALRALRVVRLWDKPLDWNETGSATKDVVTHVRKALGESAPLIEVRSKDTNRSTFTLKQAPLGPTLLAVADLADTSLWVFPGRLVLGPENLLTPEEQATIESGNGGEWQKSQFAQSNGTVIYGGSGPRSGPWDPTPILTKSVVSIAGSEIKALLAAKGATPPAPEGPNAATRMRPNMTPEERDAVFKAMREQDLRPLPYEVTFGELSPATQDKIKELVKLRYRRPEQLENTLKSITPASFVGYNDMKENQFELRLQNPKEGAPTERIEVGRWSVQKPRPAMPPLQ